MEYTRETMQKMRREELKNIAISYRIYNGYHERPISKMRKSDFIDFIHESVTTPNHSPNTRETILQNANRQEGRRRGLRPSSDGNLRRENRHNEDVIVHFIPSPLSSRHSPISFRDTLRDFDARRRIDFGSSLMGGPLGLLDVVINVLNSTSLDDEEQHELNNEEFTGTIPTEVEEENEAHETVRCAVCLHNKVCVLFQKCKHVITCGPCSLRVKECPVCKRIVESSDKIRIFLP
ncbi:hypothetical protein IIV6-T1_325 [Invertebrate iridescent virus 6]|nr:hypothetical protein IIV6-T1_325 [Invertebrate iridescent virus 6]